MHRVCLQNRLEGYDFCIRHILFDRNAPFKQCSYVHPQSNKRCPNAARRTERKDSTLCPWHIKKLCLKRKQAVNQSHRMRETTGTKSVARLLRDLEHYCPEEHEKRRRGHLWSKQEDETTIATEELRQRIAEAAASQQESDSSDPAVDQTLRGDVVDSDSDSSDGDDPLRHAGVFAAEEVSSMLSDKMHRLQNLYIEQFRHLKYLLRDRYRNYCIATLLDKDCLIPDQLSDTDADQLRAYRKYHKYRGREALLKLQAKQKRRALTDGHQVPNYPICIFEKDDVKCTNRSLPATHYCSQRENDMTLVISRLISFIICSQIFCMRRIRFFSGPVRPAVSPVSTLSSHFVTTIRASSTRI
jgi:KAT8 regulatory NSL complex subunit 2